MIVINQDMWRADCIAAIGWDEDRTIQVFPLNCSDYVSYSFDTHEEAEAAYKAILTEWKRDLARCS
jgi:hypothetical protein